MRHFILLAVALTALTGCGSGSSDGNQPSNSSSSSAASVDNATASSESSESSADSSDTSSIASESSASSIASSSSSAASTSSNAAENPSDQVTLRLTIPQLNCPNLEFINEQFSVVLLDDKLQPSGDALKFNDQHELMLAIPSGKNSISFSVYEHRPDIGPWGMYNVQHRVGAVAGIYSVGMAAPANTCDCPTYSITAELEQTSDLIAFLGAHSAEQTSNSLATLREYDVQSCNSEIYAVQQRMTESVAYEHLNLDQASPQQPIALSFSPLPSNTIEVTSDSSIKSVVTNAGVDPFPEYGHTYLTTPASGDSHSVTANMAGETLYVATASFNCGATDYCYSQHTTPAGLPAHSVIAFTRPQLDLHTVNYDASAQTLSWTHTSNSANTEFSQQFSYVTTGPMIGGFIHAPAQNQQVKIPQISAELSGQAALGRLSFAASALGVAETNNDNKVSHHVAATPLQSVP